LSRRRGEGERVVAVPASLNLAFLICPCAVVWWCSVLFGVLKFCGFSMFEKIAETFALAPKLVRPGTQTQTPSHKGVDSGDYSVKKGFVAHAAWTIYVCLQGPSCSNT
jgi:hypothetical protein